jgi:hypothetical protein
MIRYIVYVILTFGVAALWHYGNTDCIEVETILIGIFMLQGYTLREVIRAKEHC